MHQPNRRQFIQHAAAASLVTIACRSVSAEITRAEHSPFRVIYSNDTTHILSCQRPEDRTEFTDDLLRQSILEAAGSDAHFLQPGLGWMPWWPSKIYSAEDHYAWLQDKHGIKGVPVIGQYLLNGGDMLATLVDTCQTMGVKPFLSYRLNDGHHVRQLAESLKQAKPNQNMARHYWENYERFRIGPDTVEWDDGVFDWSNPEVRNYKFSLIEEACTNYDLAGLELDFLRHWIRFGPDTKPEKRFEITTAFVQRIRAMLDRTAVSRGLPRRWLCVRVPANASVRPEQGVDLAELTRAGVDMINLSHSYFTWQDDSVSRAREEVGSQPAIYAEMTHTTMTGRATAGSGTQPYLRTTAQQFYTTARLAYEQGAQGVSIFNFPYYRYHVTDTIGPFHEPPFQVLPKLKDRKFLARQSQWYFLSSGRKDRILGERTLPAILQSSHPQVFKMEMAPRAQHQGDGVLRLRSDESIADREIDVRFNGETIDRIAHVEKPLPHPEEVWLGTADEHACYAIPCSAAIRGTNRVEITVKKGIRVRLTYLEVTLP